jgi:AcrR family transcriptional regulator
MGRPKTIDDEKLLAIARAVFVRDGAFGSTRDIAKRAGISEAALFKRYPTKATLFLAAMVPPMVDAQAIVKRAKVMSDPREALLLIADQVLGFFREVMPVVLPLIRNPLIGADAVHAHFGTGQVGDLTDALAHYFKGEMRRGRMAAVNPVATAAMLVTSMHSVAQFELMGFHGGVIPEAGIHAMIGALWDGLNPRAGVRVASRGARAR